MDILINTASLLNPLTGIGNYTYQVTKWINLSEPRHKYTYFYNGKFSNKLPGPIGLQDKSAFQTARGLIDQVPLLSKYARSAWRLWRENWAIKLHVKKYDLYFEPNFLLIDVRARKKVATVHDFSFYLHPEWHLEGTVNYLCRIFFERIHQVDKIITVSKTIKKEVVDILQFNEEEVEVIYNGVDHDIFKQYPERELNKYCREKNLPENFILYVGSIEPRKNLMRLLESYEMLSNQLKRNVKLVLAGFKGWKNKQVMDKLTELGEDVSYYGYVSNYELACLYNLCTLFVYPSLYEGFGLPPLEAMACGAPALVSGIPVHKEIYGESALYFNPTSAEEMSFVLQSALEDTDIRQELKRRGKEKAKEFSWEKSAMEHLRVFEKCF